ncbi:MAG: Asp-tRNA(Asn)/Glu-tRNA(Gln) amidotransferase subunit GatC [bacterium]|nr:Asp-tRNA(Asn)/Glu-tRNA(Gln) amidotransferase subunit GatC [bacterium]
MITKEEVQHIAQLARIRINEKEVEKLQQDISGILDYFAVLKDADTSKVEATTHSIILENISREDVAHPGSPALLQKLVDMFPAVRDGLLRVKAIFSSR